MSEKPATNPTPGPEARAFNRRMPRPIGKVALALSKAQGEFEEIEKDSEGQARGGKFKYSSLAAIYKGTRKALSKNELAICHCVDGDELVSYVVHSSGEFLTSVIHIGHPKQWQEFGSCLTYAERYNASALLAVAGEDDLDAPEGERQQRQQGSQQRPSGRQQGGKGADARQASGQATSGQQSGQQTQEGKAVETARKSAEKCDTPGKLTALARRFKNRSVPERRAIAAVGKAKGWKWNKEESVFEEATPPADGPPPEDGPPSDDSFMPVDQDGNNAF